MYTLVLLLNAIIQVILFLFIPFVWWLVTARGKVRFFMWLGIHKPFVADRQKFLFCLSAILLLFLFFSILTPLLLIDQEVLAYSQFQNSNFFEIIDTLIYAFIQTSLSEELLFRGFLLKRIANKFNFQIGNFVQALLFGLLHGALFFSAVEIAALVVIVSLTTAIGWLLGYINEKQSNSSIIPSWILHGVANTCAALFLVL